MIIIELFFALLVFFPLLVMVLGALLFLRLRFYTRNPFLRAQTPRPDAAPPQDGKTIEGEYRVLDDSQEE